MKKLVVSTFLTLDGVMQAPGGPRRIRPGASRTAAGPSLDNAAWNNSTLISGDVPKAVAGLKDETGPELQVHGSGQLIQTLIKHDLVDEYRLWVFPVLLGEGKRLFADGTIPAGLRLVDAKTSSTGVVIATYERAGELDYGSFALEEPTDAEVERRRGLAES